VPLDQFELLQIALADRFNGDTGVHDLPRVLRLPGFIHRKGEPFLSLLQDVDPRPPYTVEQTRAAFPPKPEPEPRPAPQSNGITDRHRGEAWAHAALDASVADLANAGAGSRHKTLLAKANRMGTMIARGWIDTHEVRRALFVAALSNGQIKEYGEGHFNDTFKAGTTHGILTPHPDLPDNDPAPNAYALRQAIDRGTASQRTASAACLPLTIEQWLQRDLPDPDYLLGSWLTTTTRALFVADTGLGKTNFAMALGMHVAEGTDFLHWRARRPTNVLFIDGEMSRQLLKTRIADAVARLGSRPAGFCALSHEDVENFAPINSEAGQVRIAPVADRWEHDAATAARPTPVSPLGTKFLDALRNVLASDEGKQVGSRRIVTHDAWSTECVSIGLIDPEQKPDSARSMLSKYHRELIAANLIAADAKTVWLIR
jgi:AAA domain